MGDAVRRPERKLRSREQLDDLLQIPLRCLAVLGNLEMPIRERIERKREVLRRVAGLIAEAPDGELGGGQVARSARGGPATSLSV